MPELQEPPPQSDADQLKSAFNTEMKAATGIDPVATVEDEVVEGTPTLVPTKVKEVVKDKSESLIPAEFIDKKPAEVVDEPLVADEVKQNLKGKARESFDRLETAAKTRIEKLQQELAEARKQPTAAPAKEQEDAYKAALERATVLEQELERAAYERSPKFQRFGAEEKAELGIAKSYLEGTEVNAAIIDAATHANGPARIKLMREAGMDAETIAAVGPHLARADALRRERDASLENWRAGLTHDMEAQKAQAKQQKEAREVEERTIFKTVGDEMKATLPAFKRVDGHEKWNAMVEQNEKDAEAFFAGTKPLPELAKLAYLGVSARTTMVMNEELTRMLNEARSENVRLKAAQPSSGNGGEKKPEKVNADDPRNSTEHYKSSFNAHLAAARGDQ